MDNNKIEFDWETPYTADSWGVNQHGSRIISTDSYTLNTIIAAQLNNAYNIGRLIERPIYSRGCRW